MGSIPSCPGNGGNCFLRGTKILTDIDETAIENLGVGDMVSTVSGELRAIKRVISWTAERKPNRDWTETWPPSRFVAPRSRQMYLTATFICRPDMLSTSTEC